MLTSPSPIIWYTGMSDDVMSDDSTIDYIIAKSQNYFCISSKGMNFGNNLMCQTYS